MKKFALLVAGGLAAIILIVNVGPLIGLALSLIAFYFVFKQFMKENGTLGKVLWGIIGLAILSFSLASIPSLIGIAAAYVLYIMYKKWNESEEVIVEEEKDPFVNFEKQWSELKKF